MTLPITALTAAIVAIMILLTAYDTGMQRMKAHAMFGDGDGHPGLIAAMRSHGNLTEHAPIVIIMIGLLEAADAHHWTLTGIAVVFLIARACHIYGLHQPAEPGKPHFTRPVGVLGTWAVMIALIGWILWLVVTVNG